MVDIVASTQRAVSEEAGEARAGREKAKATRGSGDGCACGADCCRGGRVGACACAAHVRAHVRMCGGRVRRLLRTGLSVRGVPIPKCVGRHSRCGCAAAWVRGRGRTGAGGRQRGRDRGSWGVARRRRRGREGGSEGGSEGVVRAAGGGVGRGRTVQHRGLEVVALPARQDDALEHERRRDHQHQLHRHHDRPAVAVVPALRGPRAWVGSRMAHGAWLRCLPTAADYGGRRAVGGSRVPAAHDALALVRRGESPWRRLEGGEG